MHIENRDAPVLDTYTRYQVYGTSGLYVIIDKMTQLPLLKNLRVFLMQNSPVRNWRLSSGTHTTIKRYGSTS